MVATTTDHTLAVSETPAVTCNVVARTNHALMRTLTSQFPGYGPILDRERQLFALALRPVHVAPAQTTARTPLAFCLGLSLLPSSLISVDVDFLKASETARSQFIPLHVRHSARSKSSCTGNRWYVPDAFRSFVVAVEFSVRCRFFLRLQVVRKSPRPASTHAVVTGATSRSHGHNKCSMRSQRPQS